jgi:hypothetical protein
MLLLLMTLDRYSDSVFPNNWVSFHENGEVAVSLCLLKTERAERREEILDLLEDGV